MEQNNIVKIIRHFLSGRFPADLEERVQKWIIKDKNPLEKEQASLDYWNEQNSQVDASTYSALKRVNKKIGYTRKRNVFHAQPYRNMIRLAGVLIPACLIVSGYLYYYSVENEQLEVTTVYGETKHLLLPDSSEVWLNAGTTIQYPKKYGKEQRLISLEGEAYFSVRKEIGKPFIVQTRQLSVKVLGTKFNVKAYSEDDKTIATLTSGKVEVCAENKETWMLDPNQQISYSNKGKIAEITELSSEETYAWVSGQMYFIHTPFHEIVKTIERHYNVVITNQVEIAPSKQFTIKFLKNEKLDEVLDILGEMIGFSYLKKENKVILRKVD